MPLLTNVFHRPVSPLIVTITEEGGFVPLAIQTLGNEKHWKCFQGGRNSVIPGRSEGNIKIVSVLTPNIYFIYKRAVGNKL